MGIESTLAHFFSFQAGTTPVTPFSGGHKRVFGDIEPWDATYLQDLSSRLTFFSAPLRPTACSFTSALLQPRRSAITKAPPLCFLNPRWCASSDWPRILILLTFDSHRLSPLRETESTSSERFSPPKDKLKRNVRFLSLFLSLSLLRGNFDSFYRVFRDAFFQYE